MIIWIVFFVLIVAIVAIDLGLFHKNPHAITTKEAGIWTSVWVSVALLFSIIVYFSFQNGWIDNPTEIDSTTATIKYITGYFIELSLSVDNIFIIAIIFSSFAIPLKFQHEVLFYGILGAIIFRGLMILFGVTLINQFDWMIYVFGGFLIFTSLKMLFEKDKESDPKQSFLYKTLKKIFPITDELDGGKFFTRVNKKRLATPLFVVLIIIEFSDLFFALDSIPAVIAITSDPFIIFSSNIFAVLGLRSMYFFISNMLVKFKYIHYSLILILAFVGIKMLLSKVYQFPEWVSLSAILLFLLGGIIISIIKNKSVANDSL